MDSIAFARSIPQTSLDPSAFALNSTEKASSPEKDQQAAHVSQQFEAILMRQFLSESMKPLLEQGPSGQVYGYLLTDSLAGTLAEGGGMGLAHILQAQLSK